MAVTAEFYFVRKYALQIAQHLYGRGEHDTTEKLMDYLKLEDERRDRFAALTADVTRYERRKAHSRARSDGRGRR